MMNLTYGGKFDENDLVSYLQEQKRNYIIQGQQKVGRTNHSKKESLDYWLRQFADNPDTKAGDNEIVAKLVATGLFEVAPRLRCPDSGNYCKGLRLVRCET